MTALSQDGVACPTAVESTENCKKGEGSPYGSGCTKMAKYAEVAYVPGYWAERAFITSPAVNEKIYVFALAAGARKVTAKRITNSGNAVLMRADVASIRLPLDTLSPVSMSKSMVGSDRL